MICVAQRRVTRLERVQARLGAYLDLEAAILAGTATKEYRTSVLGADRYNVTLTELQRMIAGLEKQEAALLSGRGGLQFVRIAQCDNVGRDERFRRG